MVAEPGADLEPASGGSISDKHVGVSEAIDRGHVPPEQHSQTQRNEEFELLLPSNVRGELG